MENVSNEVLETLLHVWHNFLPTGSYECDINANLKAIIDKLDSGEYTILYNKDLTK